METKAKRDVGIDVLRIVSMCMIIILHIINKGVDYEGMGAIVEIEHHYLRSIVMCSVNVYVIVSAYYLRRNNVIRVGKVLRMILEYWVINFIVSITLVIVGICKLEGIEDYCYLIFPFISRRNWFVNVYLLMYILHPFLNKCIDSLDKKSFSKLIMVLITVFSIFPSIMPNRNWTYDVSMGYSITWFISLYFITVFFVEYSCLMNRSKKAYLFAILICGGVITLVKYAIMFVSKRFALDALAKVDDFWYAYDTLPILIISLCVFALFKGIRVNKTGTVTNAISRLGASSLGVYLIHDNFKMREVLWSKIVPVKSLCCFIYSPLFYILISFGVYILCALIYIVFAKIVTLLKIDNIKNIEIK